MKNPLNVVMFNNYPIAGDPTSGSPTIFEGFTNHLSLNKNVKLNVISMGSKTAVFEMEHFVIFQIKKNRLLYVPFLTPLFYYKVKKIVDKINPDVIHVGCTGYWNFFIALMLQKKYPLVTTVLGILSKEFMYRQKEFKKNWIVEKYKVLFEKYSLSRLKHLIVPTRHIIPVIKDISNTKATFYKVYDGIEYEKIQKIRPIAELTGDVLFLSTLDKLKGVDVLIKAVSLIINEIPNIKVLIGGKGPREEKLKLLVKELNLENNIIFKGVIKGAEKKYGAIKSCKILVAPSRWDCQPYAVIEGAACAKATMAADTSNPDFLDDKKTGLVFESDNHIDFADKLKQLLLNDHLRKKMGDDGLIKSKVCDWSIIVDQSIEIYFKVIDTFNTNIKRNND